MGNKIMGKVPQGAPRSLRYLHKHSLSDVESTFDALAKRGKDKATIDRTTFSTTFDFSPRVADSIFNEFDRNSDGCISRDEFVRGLAMTSSGSMDSKLRFCFEKFDTSGDGYLQRNELEGMVLSTTYSSFALLEAVGRSLSSEARRDMGAEAKHPMDNLIQKAMFQEEVRWVVRQAYKDVDHDQDSKLNLREFLEWCTSNQQVLNVLYGIFEHDKQQRRAHQGSSRNSSSQEEGQGSRKMSLFRSDNDGGGSDDDLDASPQRFWSDMDKDSHSRSAQPPSGPMFRRGRVSPEPDTSSSKMSTTRKRAMVRKASLRRKGTESHSIISSSNKEAELTQSWQSRGILTFVFSLAGILLMIVDGSLADHSLKESMAQTILRSICSANVLVVVVCLTRWMSSYVAMLKVQGHLNSVATLCGTPHIRKRLAIEICIALIHPPPLVMTFLAGNPSLHYWVTCVLRWGMLLRLHLLPVMLQQHFVKHYVSTREVFLARLSNVQFSVLFTTRAYLVLRPFSLLLVVLVVFCLSFTFLLQEAELGLECVKETVNTTMNVTMNGTDTPTWQLVTTSAAAGGGGAGGATEWHWLYADACHPAQHGSLGWTYYMLNLLLAVDPLRVPLTPAGDFFNIVAGMCSQVIFAILVATIYITLEPSKAEQRVIYVIQEEMMRRKHKGFAVQLIQKTWRQFVSMKRRARKLGGERFERDYESIRSRSDRSAMVRDLVGDKRLQSYRKALTYALESWKLQKKSLRSTIPILEDISKSTSHIIDEGLQAKDAKAAVVKTLREADLRLSARMAFLESRVQLIMQNIRR